MSVASRSVTRVRHRTARLDNVGCAYPARKLRGRIGQHAGNVHAPPQTIERRTDRRVRAGHAGNAVARAAAVLLQQHATARRVACRLRMERWITAGGKGCDHQQRDERFRAMRPVRFARRCLSSSAESVHRRHPCSLSTARDVQTSFIYRVPAGRPIYS